MQPDIDHTLSSSLTHFHTVSFVPKTLLFPADYFFPEEMQLSFSDINALPKNL
jgi:hypothetical protein